MIVSLAALALFSTRAGAQIELEPRIGDLGAAPLAAPAFAPTPLPTALPAPTLPADWAPATAAASAECPTPAGREPAPQLPRSRYSARIRTDASGARAVWLVVPPSSGGPGRTYELGPLTMLKAGTPLYHWGGEDVDSTLASGRLDEAALDARILRRASADDDLWGGGFYVSSRLADSSDYGPRAARTLAARGALVVLCGAIAPAERLDVVLALREAGVDALQETAHPSWYNFVRAGALSGPFSEPTPDEAIDSIRGEPAREAIEDLLLYDQRYPVDVSRLPADAAAPLRALARGRPLDDAGRASLTAAMSKVATMLLLMRARGDALRRTPLFDAYDDFVRRSTGRSLAEILSS